MHPPKVHGVQYMFHDDFFQYGTLSEATSSSEQRRTELSSKWYHLIMPAKSSRWTEMLAAKKHQRVGLSAVFTIFEERQRTSLAMLSILEVYQMILTKKCANLKNPTGKNIGGPALHQWKTWKKLRSVLSKASHQPRLKSDSSLLPMLPL